MQSVWLNAAVHIARRHIASTGTQHHQTDATLVITN